MKHILAGLVLSVLAISMQLNTRSVSMGRCTDPGEGKKINSFTCAR